MDLAKREKATLVPSTEIDIRRVVALWSSLLKGFGGPWLLGPEWSIADAFYTPVATRFRSYGVLLSDFGDTGPAGAYAERPAGDAGLPGMGEGGPGLDLRSGPGS